MRRDFGRSCSSRPRSTRRARSTRSSGLGTRSEEHTSELQSRGHLVCRLLLEKKNRSEEVRSTSKWEWALIDAHGVPIEITLPAHCVFGSKVPKSGLDLKRNFHADTLGSHVL